MKILTALLVSLVSTLAFAQQQAQVTGFALLSGETFGSLSSVAVSNVRLSEGPSGTAVVSFDLTGSIQTGQRDTSTAVAIVEPLPGSLFEKNVKLSVALAAPAAGSIDVWLGATALPLFVRSINVAVSLNLGMAADSHPLSLDVSIPLGEMGPRRGNAHFRATVDGKNLTVSPLQEAWQR